MSFKTYLNKNRMNKILIIGQAPPAVEQTVPYDTTMLYDMFSWAGISKEQAQDIFEFEAISNIFPGFKPNGGHKTPSREDCDKQWEKTLETKLQLAEEIIVLGAVAKQYIESKPKTWSCSAKFVYIIHPSKRNYNKIMAQKESIVNNLKWILNL